MLATALVNLAPAVAQAPKKAVASPALQKEFDGFIEKFRAALRTNDSAAVAGMTRLPFMNGNRVIPATAAESFVLSAARNFSMKPSNSFCKAGEATAFFGAWATAGARFTRAVASIILSKNPTGRLRPSTNQVFRPIQIH